MIVPRNNLLWGVALFVFPAAAVGGMIPGLRGVCVTLIAVLAGVALLDAAFSPGLLAGVAVRLPPVSRLTQGRKGALDLELINEKRRPIFLVLGLPFPEEIESERSELEILLPAEARVSRTRWEVRPTRRGRYKLGRIYMERTSPLGLWAVRASRPLEGEIRVYPDLVPESRTVAAIFLPRGGVGLRQRRQVGRGREFEKLREYIPGDALADLHWKATARRGRPITKLYQVERTQEIYLIVDTSRLSAREFGMRDDRSDYEHDDEREHATTNKSQTILDKYLGAALVTCQAAARQGDLFGLITFSDRTHCFIPARNGRAHYNVCRDAIHALEPRPVTPDFDELFTTIRLRLRKRALLVFLTNLDDPTLAESFQRRLDLVCRHHLVLTGMMAPPEARELFDTPDVEAETDIYRRLSGHMLWNDLRLLERALARRGVRFNLFSHEDLVPELVGRYLEIKQRQLL